MTALWYYFRFLVNKLLSLSSNILSFSFKQSEHLFDWGVYALNWFFIAHVIFGLAFPAFKFEYSTYSFVSFLYLLMLNDLLLFAYRFLNVFSLIRLKFLGWQYFLSDFLVAIYRIFPGGNFRSAFDLSFWSAVAKIYPFPTLRCLTKNENIEPNKFCHKNFW